MDIGSFQGLELWRQTVYEMVRKNDAASDLTTRQIAVLLCVYLTPPPHTVRELAAELNISKPAISRAVDKLSVLGLVKRQTDEKDRRSVNLERTLDGASYVTNLGDLIVEKSKNVENPFD